MNGWEDRMYGCSYFNNKGFGLNKILGENARNMFIYGLLLSIGFLLG